MSQTQRVVIVSDTMASMGVAMGEEHGIHIVPLYVTFDTQQYRDDIDLPAGFQNQVRDPR